MTTHPVQPTPMTPARTKPVPPLKLISVAMLGLAIVLIVVLNFALGAALSSQTASWTPLASGLAQAGILLVSAVLPLWFLVYRPIQRAAETAREVMESETAVLHERLRAHDLNVRLTAALEMAENEDGVMRIARQALSVAAAGAPAQLMLADAPDSPIRYSLVEGEMPTAATCQIERPCDCPAVRRGLGTVYEDSLVLSACRGLKGPIAADCAAACTPITVSGSGVGMIRALGTTSDPMVYRLLQSLNTAAHHVGTRLAVIRSISASARQAAIDPLTGAANRRSAEARLAELAQHSQNHVLAMIDIDFFKKINDNHGHEVGDRAIKLLVDTIRECIRQDDMVCRFGGEEFLLILPGIDRATAVAMLQRLRGLLPNACSKAGLPAFTISAGIADAPTANPQLQIRAADAALYRAKHTGRDRVICAEDELESAAVG